MPTAVTRDAAEELLEEEYSNYLRIFTDGSVNPNTWTATAAFYIPELAISFRGRLNYCSTSTTAELAAIIMALRYIKQHQQPRYGVILTDSRGALLSLLNPDSSSILARTAAFDARRAESDGWKLIFQWIPAHSGIKGNERADALAAEAHGDDSPTIFLHRLIEAERLTKGIIQLRHPDPDVAIRRPPTPVPHSVFKRSDNAMLHRLRANCVITGATLHRWGKVNTPNCETCAAPETIEHLLFLCPQFSDARTKLMYTLRQGGFPRSTLKDLTFPSGPPSKVRQVFTAVLTFLRDTKLIERI